MFIIIAVAVLGILGFIFGIILAYSSKKFAVKINPRVEYIMELLPGLNCGACGFPGCIGYAEAIVNDNADITKCSVGGKDVVDGIAKLVGKDAEGKEKKVAMVFCQGSVNNSPEKSIYHGIQDCEAVSLMGTGCKSCRYGCLSLGNCVRACPFDAIVIDKNTKIPKVRNSNCVGCGLCVSSCPRELIKLVPVDKNVHILCCSCDKGAEVRKICKTGCIACGICVKNCPTEAITIENNIAVIEYEKCIDCGVCINKCPTKVIINSSTENLF